MALRLPPATSERVAKHAAAERRSLNMMVTILLEEALDAREVKTPPKMAESPRS